MYINKTEAGGWDRTRPREELLFLSLAVNWLWQCGGNSNAYVYINLFGSSQWVGFCNKGYPYRVIL